MNWRRGLLRAWVLLSGLWILTIATLAGVASYNDWRIESVMGTPVPKTDRPDFVQSDQQDTLAKLDEQYGIRLYKPDHPTVAGYMLIALAPPAAILVLGLGVFWVIAGFRRAST